MINTRFWLNFVAATGLLTASACAQTTTANSVVPVLELFTSQGCSSCPAADALFKSYTGRRDVVALTMPVDYWDYLGWKDTLANPKFSKRQRAYAKMRGDGQIYTPQVVVDGRNHVNGAARKDIEAALDRARATPSGMALSGSVAGDMITIEVSAAGKPVTDSTVWLAVVQPEAEVEIRAGENRGRKLTYFNVVREMSPLGAWSGAAATIRQQVAALSAGSGDRLAVLVQAGLGGPILSAAWIEPQR